MSRFSFTLVLGCSILSFSFASFAQPVASSHVGGQSGAAEAKSSPATPITTNDGSGTMRAPEQLRRIAPPSLAADPKDAFSWSLLGSLKVRQGKYDEALEALSQAAQLDPQDADTFQNLGVVLAEKGLREPAETAFRRAIRLAPGNGDAHHNLAVIYATQQPPSLELARWHYQKAMQAGHGRNAAVEKVLRTNTVAAGGGVEALNH